MVFAYGTSTATPTLKRKLKSSVLLLVSSWDGRKVVGRMVVLLPVGKIVVGSNVVGNSVSGRRGVGFGVGRFVGSVITTVKKGAGVGRG